MKKIILILLLLVVSNTYVYAQDKEPENMRFYNPTTSNTFEFDINNVPQTKFMLGWQWDGHQRMGEALKMNEIT